MFFQMSRRGIRFAQHYVECKQCKGNAEYYCYTCTNRLCQVCRDRHAKNTTTKAHTIVPYLSRKITPNETCRLHPGFPFDIACQDCHRPICIRCMQKYHEGHTFKSIEDVLQEKDDRCKEKIKKINKTILPHWHERLSQLFYHRRKSKSRINEIKIQLYKDVKKLKLLAEAILVEKIKEIEIEENWLKKELDSLTNVTLNTISKYENLITEYENEHRSYEKLRLQKDILQSDSSEPTFRIPSAPSYRNEKIRREEISKLFSNLILTTRTLETRPPIKCHEFKLPFNLSKHISNVPPEKFWIGNNDGQIILINKTGKQLDEIKTNGFDLLGYHTVTLSGELLFIEELENCVKKYTSGRRPTTIINTGDWKPGCIYSSHRSGDILAGMKNYKLQHDPSKVVRYNKNGLELWQSQCDDKGQPLYRYPIYITENVNGDICISDYDAVVVLNNLGKHRFSYRGSQDGSKFRPFSICADILGRILVIDGKANIQMIDQNGKFLTVLSRNDHSIPYNLGLCNDKENNLWMCDGNTVKMYKYLW
ncbi:uncharacterized protein LOC133181185 [Saccostrea echinata]|uniref:uncharacterized protein LOC133181185 n=1 Tax=Saccostrea echinata TaxID=191078 RepID=UPI002A7FC8C5|nr:uncharacterized protein LOC133181185 [Saccostrea echinata]